MIEDLDALVNLEELWLGKNKLTKIEVRGERRSGKLDTHCSVARIYRTWTPLQTSEYYPFNRIES